MDERGLPLSRSTYERLARLNLICCLLYLCSYAALFVHDPLRVTCSVILPLVFANLYSGIRPYLEHSNTDDGLLTCARSRTHWLFVSFYYGNSLHLEHHLYPSVPCYRLPRVHRWLVSQGFVPASHPSYEPRGLSSFRWAVAAHAYGARDPLSPRSAR
jgi:fatty acid desaturase